MHYCGGSFRQTPVTAANHRSAAMGHDKGGDS